MAARPPVGDDDQPEPTAFGIAAVDDHLRNAALSYPATPAEVVDALGDPAIPCGPNGHDVSLSTAVERTGRTRFGSRRELLDELHDEFERERREGGGLVSWIRSLVG
jgi:hypothetical protein